MHKSVPRRHEPTWRNTEERAASPALGTLAALLGAVAALGCGSARPPHALQQEASASTDPLVGTPDLHSAMASSAAAAAAAAETISPSSPEDLPWAERPPEFPRFAVCASSAAVKVAWDGHRWLSLRGIVSELGSARGELAEVCPAATPEQRIALGGSGDADVWADASSLRMVAEDGSEVVLAVQATAAVEPFAFGDIAGAEVELFVETMGASGGMLELRKADGALELWVGMASSVDALRVPAELELAPGPAEYRTGGDCAGRASADSSEQALVFRQFALRLGDESRNVPGGEQLLLKRFIFTHAGVSEPVAPGACAGPNAGWARAALWPGCTEVVQVSSARSESGELVLPAANGLSSGLLRCGPQIVVNALPTECTTDQGPIADGASPCGSDADCEEGQRCRDDVCEEPPECMSSSDCPSGHVCLCAGVANGSGVVGFNQCVAAECSGAADCGGLECALSPSLDCSERPYAGAHCQASGGACESLRDCAGQCARSEAGSWSCLPEPSCGE